MDTSSTSPDLPSHSPLAETIDVRDAQFPTALRLVAVGALLSVILLVGLPVGMFLDRDATMATILRSRPSLPSSHRGFALVAVIGYAAVLHTLDVVLVVWFTAKTLHGRHWARVALSIYVIAASVLGLWSASAGPPYLFVVIMTDIIHMIMLCLLWLPRPVRTFFRAHRRSSRG